MPKSHIAFTISNTEALSTSDSADNGNNIVSVKESLWIICKNLMTSYEACLQSCFK